MTHHDHEHDAMPAALIGPKTLAFWMLAAILAAVFIGLRISTGPDLSVERWLFLIPLMPAVASAINGIFLNRLPKPLVTALAVGSVLISFVISLVLFIAILPQWMTVIAVPP